MPKSLRVDVERSINQAIGKPKSNGWVWYYPVAGLMIGALSWITLLPGPPLLVVPNSNDVWTWLSILWGATATLFGLTVATSSLLVGLGLQGTDRSEVIKLYRQQSGFDGVITYVFSFFANSGGVVSFLMFRNWMENLSDLSGLLTITVVFFILFIFTLWWLVFIAVKIVTRDKLGANKPDYIKNGTELIIRQVATEKLSSERLKKWAATNDIVYDARFPIPRSPFPIFANCQGVIWDINLRKLTIWASLLDSTDESKAFLKMYLGQLIDKKDILATTMDDNAHSPLLLHSISIKRRVARDYFAKLYNDFIALSDEAITCLQGNDRYCLANALEGFQAFWKIYLHQLPLLREKCQINADLESHLVMLWLRQVNHVGGQP